MDSNLTFEAELTNRRPSDLETILAATASFSLGLVAAGSIWFGLLSVIVLPGRSSVDAFNLHIGGANPANGFLIALGLGLTIVFILAIVAIRRRPHYPNHLNHRAEVMGIGFFAGGIAGAVPMILLFAWISLSNSFPASGF